MLARRCRYAFQFAHFAPQRAAACAMRDHQNLRCTTRPGLDPPIGWTGVCVSRQGGLGAPGIAIWGTPGVPSLPASHGRASAKADAADEK
jgi:hypothetical protein